MKLINANELAKHLSVPISRIRHMVFDKQLPFIKIGSSVRFDLEDIGKWIESMKVPADKIVLEKTNRKETKKSMFGVLDKDFDEDYSFEDEEDDERKHM